MKGLKGVLVGDANKKAQKFRRQNNSLEGAEVMLEAEGWVMVNKKPARRQTKILRGPNSFWRAEGWVMVHTKPASRDTTFRRVQSHSGG